MTDVRTVNNFSFVNDEGVMVDITKKRRGRIFLHGKYTTSWTLFMGTENCLTSAVLDIQENKVTTRHSVYQLGDISPDYQEFLDATRRGMLAVGNWNIYGSKDRRYYLTADIFPQRKSLTMAKIIFQNGNLLTIQRLVKIPDGEQIWEEPEQVFVCWNSMSKHAATEIEERGKVADLPYVKFQKFNGKICRPVLEI